MNEDIDAVSHVHEENEVHKEPQQPSGEATDLQAGYADHGGLAPDRCHGAFVPVNERWARPSLILGGHELGDELAHLNGRRRHARHDRVASACLPNVCAKEFDALWKTLRRPARLSGGAWPKTSAQRWW